MDGKPYLKNLEDFGKAVLEDLWMAVVKQFVEVSYSGDSINNKILRRTVIFFHLNSITTLLGSNILQETIFISFCFLLLILVRGVGGNS